MRKLASVSILPIAALLMSAAPEPSYIPLGKYEEGVVIPAGSPLKFRRFDSYDSAQFTGRLLIEGVFVIECEDCEPGSKGTSFHLTIIPDPAIAARLPHWKKHDNDIAIDITGAEAFIRSIVPPAKRKLLLSGKLDEVRGRTAIIVNRYEASLNCDSADYSARFVAVAKPGRLAKAETSGSYGCGFI
jgi:hypothetical protein